MFTYLNGGGSLAPNNPKSAYWRWYWFDYQHWVGPGSSLSHPHPLPGVALPSWLGRPVHSGVSFDGPDLVFNDLFYHAPVDTIHPGQPDYDYWNALAYSFGGGNDPVSVPTVHIVADTDRDGKIDANDDGGRAQPSPGRGAIFNVNLDRDNALPSVADPDYSGYTLVPNDGLTLDTNGKIVSVRNADGTLSVQGDNVTIDGPNDVPDVTPFKIQIQAPDGAGWRYFLKIDPQSARAVHVFPSLDPGSQRVLGGPSLVKADGTPSVVEKEITSGFSSNGGLDRTFGIEGLAFRGMKLPLAGVPNDAYQFNGTVALTVEARKYDAGGGVVKTVADTILLKVAPFILRSNVDASKELWVAKDPDGLNQSLLKTLEDALGGSGQLKENLDDYRNSSQWYQDHCEIGYTGRPGQLPLMDCVLELPYLVRPPWVQSKLLNGNTSVFQLGRYLYDSSDPDRLPTGDFGGNVECIPPFPGRPLGAILVGTTSSKALKAFLSAQEVQPVVEVDTKWLEVGHVDEILQFVKNAEHPDRLKCVVACPGLAFDALDPSADVNTGVEPFFTDHRNRRTLAQTPATANASIAGFGQGATFSGGKMILPQPIVSIPPAGNGAPSVASFNPDSLFVKFVTGGARGLILEIKSIDLGQKAHTIGRAWMAPTTVMNSGVTEYGYAHSRSQAIHLMDAAYLQQEIAKVTPDDEWMTMDGMKFWITDDRAQIPSPSGISAAEVYNDEILYELNMDIQDTIEEVETQLQAVTNYRIDFVHVPTIYMTNTGIDPGSDPLNRSALAFTPGLANLQPANGLLFAPDPFAPNADFASGLGWLTLADDWDLYHRQEGEVHCGTNVRRTGTPTVPWWTQLP